MDRLSDEYIQQAQEAVSSAVDDLHSVESSPERDENGKFDGNAATQTDF